MSAVLCTMTCASGGYAAMGGFRKAEVPRAILGPLVVRLTVELLSMRRPAEATALVVTEREP